MGHHGRRAAAACLCASLVVTLRLEWLFLPSVRPSVSQQPRQAHGSGMPSPFDHNALCTAGYGGKHGRIALRAGFGEAADEEASSGAGQPARNVQNMLEDIAFQMHSAMDLAEACPEPVRVVSVSVPKAVGPVRSVDAATSTIILVGVSHVNMQSAELVKGIVSEIKPTALVLEICKERLADAILLDSTHRRPRPKNLMNTEADAFRRASVVEGGEMRSALAAFHDVPGDLNKTKLLVLGDMLDSQIKEAVHGWGLHDVTHPKVRKLRDQHIAASIYSAARLGHTDIVAPMGAAHVEGVEDALHLMSDTYEFPAKVGAFISEKGIDKLMQIKQKLIKDIPANRLQRIFHKEEEHEHLAGREEDLLQRFRAMTSATRVWHRLQLDGFVHEPDSFNALGSWYLQSASAAQTSKKLRRGRDGKRKVRTGLTRFSKPKSS